MENAMKAVFASVLLLPATLLATYDLSHFTTVGNLAMTVTNFGVIGHGYNIQGQPSCVYKYHTTLEFEEVEHLSYGGFWMGGIVNDSIRVTTGIIDGNLNVARGWEWNPTTQEAFLIRSSIINSPDYSPSAISHQDFLCSYTDTALYNEAGEFIEDHNPLGVKVNLRSYAWNYSFADAFVILEHQIINLDSENTIEDVYAGYWVDEAVGNFNLHDYYSPGGGGWYWYDNMVGAVKVATTETDTTWLPIGYDFDGDDGYSESIIGARFLGADGPGVIQDFVHTTFGFWEWNNHGAIFHPELVMPANDAERYNCLASTEDVYDDNFPYYEEDDAAWMLLSGAGNFGDLPPGDTLTVVFAMVAGRWSQVSDPEAPPWDVLQDRATEVISHSDNAQAIYNGEDINGNHILDPGEDINQNGILDHYYIPLQPPYALTVNAGDGQAEIQWFSDGDEAALCIAKLLENGNNYTGMELLDSVIVSPVGTHTFAGLENLSRYAIWCYSLNAFETSVSSPLYDAVPHSRDRELVRVINYRWDEEAPVDADLVESKFTSVLDMMDSEYEYVQIEYPQFIDQAAMADCGTLWINGNVGSSDVDIPVSVIDLYHYLQSGGGLVISSRNLPARSFFDPVRQELIHMPAHYQLIPVLNYTPDGSEVIMCEEYGNLQLDISSDTEITWLAYLDPQIEYGFYPGIWNVPGSQELDGQFAAMSYVEPWAVYLSVLPLQFCFVDEAYSHFNDVLGFVFEDTPSRPPRIHASDFPEVITLLPNYPNPFNAATQLQYQVGRQTCVEVNLYDIRGRLIGKLASGVHNAGLHSIELSATDLPSGVYFIEISAAETSKYQKIALIK